MPELLSRPLLADALRNAVTEVLEKMFFIRVLEDPREAAEFSMRERPYGEPEIAVSVIFHGEPSGRLSLCLGRRIARAIAADFLGEEEPELGNRQVEEVIAELANMVCGAVLSSVESAATFRLDTPVLIDPDRAKSRQREAAVHTFPIGGSSLTVKLWMEEPACGSSEKFVF
jgi:CheY-specific phosphatase CheX